MAHDDEPPDDLLAGIDLAAWQPPVPPAGLADAVLARLREPPPVVAIDPAPTAPPPSRRARVAWIAGAIAAAAAVATGITRWGTTRAPGPSTGVVIASAPQHVVLDATIADLDPGAELRWERVGQRLTVHQVRGTVRWTIADDDVLRLDAAPQLHPGGTDSAAIEASGASLRVEVPMNLVDMKIVGMTTATAAVAAVITVAVYQGHINATSGGQTVRIEPGATVELRPSPPTPPPAPTVERAPVHISPVDLDRLRLTGAKYIQPDPVTQEAINLAGVPVVGDFRLCVAPTGQVSNVTRLRSTRFDRYDQTIDRTMRTWTYKPYLVDGVAVPVCADITYIYTSEQGSKLDRCDPHQLDDSLTQAANQFANGEPAQSLLLIRGVLECKQDTRTYRFAAIYACAARDEQVAREMIAKVPAQYRAPIQQKCAAEGIELAR